MLFWHRSILLPLRRLYLEEFILAATKPSLVQEAFDLLDFAPPLTQTQRYEARRHIRRIIELAEKALVRVGLQTLDLDDDYLGMFACLADRRHIFPRSGIVAGRMTVSTRVSKEPDEVFEILRCMRCDTVRLKRHQLNNWFAPQRSGGYEISPAYGELRRQLSSEQAAAILAAVELFDILKSDDPPIRP